MPQHVWVFLNFLNTHLWDPKVIRDMPQYAWVFLNYLNTYLWGPKVIS